jgi:hypothetical protein
MQGALSWAKQFFGTLEVAALLRKRVVSMAASAMESPEGPSDERSEAGLSLSEN